jgi:hypothetical protein
MSASRAIGWEEQRRPVFMTLRVHSSLGVSELATDEDLQKAGYVKRENVTTSIEIREAEAWRKIDRWLLVDPDNRATTVTPANKGLNWYALAMNCTSIYEARNVSQAPQTWYRSKTEALEALAAWCEGQK